MAKAKNVASVVLEETEPQETPRNPEAAAEAIGQLTFVEGQDDKQPTPDTPPTDRPKPRQTKAELAAKVQQQEAEIARLKEQAAANAPNVIDAMKMPLKLSFNAVGNIMASWKGEHWKLAEQETATLAEAWAPCIAPLLARHPESVMWAAAIGVTYSIAYPRINVDKQKALEAKNAAEGDEATVEE